MENLNTVQQVLRAFMLSLMASTDIDRATLSEALTRFAEHPLINEEARMMLNDLAKGATATAPSQGQAS